MIATDRNAYLFHESGLKLMTLFPSSLDWPVFDVNYFDGRFYIASYFGLYIFDEASMGFVARISSGGDIQSAEASAAPDPIYATTIDGDRLWASTYRGLVEFNLLTDEGQLYLSPHTPFKPRGLSFVGTRVWVGTDTGLFSFEPKTSSWRHYTQNDGLISNFVTDLVAKDDYIWIGTNLGLTRIKWQNLY